MNDNEKYQQHRQKAADRRREQTAAGQEIGPLPPVADPQRKAACGESLRLFCETYFRPKFNLAWSPDHLKAIDRMERCVRGDGLFALAMDRGSGKTELSKRACEWALLYGYRRFVMLVGAAEDKADQLMQDIKASFETNDLLLADFPEVCHPIRKLEGETRKCIGQRLNGERTKIKWKDGEIRLPMVAGSLAAGAVIRTEGLTGAIRGASTTAADGGTMRPDLAILDDPQTRKSAGSLTMNNEREAIVRGDVLGLAGPDRSISCIMPCTVIYPDDLADRMLDRDRSPQWNGERCKRVYAFPTNTVLWDRYADVRAEGMRAGDGGAAGNAFYDENQAELDAGCVVGWPERFDPRKSRSAIQEAMNRKIDDPLAFAAECQNEPLSLNPAAANALDPDAVAKKFTNVPRRTVPRECTRLTAFIDVGDHVHWYVVIAWDEWFGGSVVDYGPYPDQTRAHFPASSPNPALGDLAGVRGQPQERAIYAGLEAVAERIIATPYRQEETGTELYVERCPVDANNGPRTDLVYDFCRRSARTAVLIPSHGKFFGASSQPMSAWAPRPGERAGPGWRLAPATTARGRHVTFDANMWKSFAAERLRTPAGVRGCLSLFKPETSGHWMLGEHCGAEYPDLVSSKTSGREVEEWKDFPNRDNHLWDCLVGATLAASIQGLKWSPSGAAVAQVEPRKKVKLSDVFAAKHGGRR